MMNHKSTPSKIQLALRKNTLLITLVTLLLIGLTIFNQIGFIVTIIIMILVHRLRKSTLYELGLSKPKSWIKTTLISMLLTTIILTVFMLVINPIIFNVFPPESKDLSRYNSIKDNELMLVIAIVSSWITAGFAEELIWRGFIMKNLAEIMGSKTFSWVISLFITSILFGLLHFTQGPIGIIQTGIMGLLFGIMFIVNGKQNLWMNIIIHGIIDSISMIALYFGFL